MAISPEPAMLAIRTSSSIPTMRMPRNIPLRFPCLTVLKTLARHEFLRNSPKFERTLSLKIKSIYSVSTSRSTMRISSCCNASFSCSLRVDKNRLASCASDAITR
jgi:hypothetical protein